MKKSGQCKLCNDKPIDYTKSDIVPKWFIRGFKDGPSGGYYIDLLRGKPGGIGERGDAYFVDDEALCKKCNNERLSAWEGPSKAFYDGFVKGAKGPLDYGPWFYSFCTSLSWRVLTFLRRVGDNREILDDPRVADALESWRLFMMTGDPSHIKGHSQHLFLADPKYGDVLQGITTSFRLFDVIRLTTRGDRQLLDTLETLVGAYTPTQVHRVTAAKNRICQAGWGDDLITMTWFGTFTLIGLVGTEQLNRWKKCGRLAVNGGRLDLSNSMNFRALLGMLSHEMKMWARLHEKGDDKLAKAYYREMIDPGAAVLCCAAGV
jgi:hypothetical protein